MIETGKLEWKREFTEDIKKELVAFANSDGGELIIGIDNSGNVLGVSNPDQVAAQVTNMIRDSIQPDLTLHTHVYVEDAGNRPLIHVVVHRGCKRPYYIAKKGMTSTGVYVRQGNTSAPATADAIREMIRETDGYSYERNLSFEQKLSFEYCTKVFSEKGIKFGKPQMQTLKIINQDGQYTNLGMLLSDQCLHSIQFACFQGTEIGTFIERQRFTGSLLKQLDESFSAMSRYNRTRSEIQGLRRIDSRDYPEGALREALMNAVVHRDYDRDVSTNIRVFDDRIEIASYGGLPANTTIDTFMLGLSMPRNRNLADIFYRLELIEAFGSGIPKMTDLYRAQGRQILFKTTESGFMVILPNLHYGSPETATRQISDSAFQDHPPVEYEQAPENRPPTLSEPGPVSQTGPASLKEQRIQQALALIQGKGLVHRADLEDAWQLSRSAASLWINTLLDEGILISVGNGRSRRYTTPGLMK